MGLFDRVSRLVRSNVNAAISNAEDPEKILEQTVLDMQEDLVQFRQAVAQAIASQKRLEQQYNQAQNQASEWYRRAQMALQKGDETLAREALTRRQSFTETATSLKNQLDNSVSQVAKLKRNMTALESKLAEAKTKKEMLKARARAAKANEQLNRTLGSVDTASAMGAFDRMEDKVLQMEAQSEAVMELSSDSLESQFAMLEMGSGVDSELEMMKAQLAGTDPNAAALPAGETPVQVSEPEKAPVDAELEQLRAQLDES
ncbi:PspA/IM30 family protein [Lyngbya confervoides]|uniref:PspA/IM30 family protein n=1 Tax=Lyngbya confervoides BDU141951 TaxID=1574623 RepID=A0ABD4SY00_9CYAN|nr:PspA/IM30 family protein [Lyngbya confervoides]MCM1981376.1 PspA/IM30 family protein [Lyngbya confervoides BDU141951]